MVETVTILILETQKQTLLERKIEPIPFHGVKKLILEANRMGLKMREITGIGGVRRERGNWLVDLVVEGEE